MSKSDRSGIWDDLVHLGDKKESMRKFHVEELGGFDRNAGPELEMGIFEDYTGPDNPVVSVFENEKHWINKRYNRSCITACKHIAENMLNYLEKNVPSSLYNPVYKLVVQIELKDVTNIEAGKQFDGAMSIIIKQYLDELIARPIEERNEFDMAQIIPILSALRIIRWTYSYNMFTEDESYVRFKRVSEDLFNHMDVKTCLDLNWFKDWPIISEDIKIGYFIRKVPDGLNGSTLKHHTIRWFVKERY